MTRHSVKAEEPVATQFALPAGDAPVIFRGARAKLSAGAESNRTAFQQLAVKPPPQVDFLVDARGVVLDVESQAAGGPLQRVADRRGVGVHERLHPGCQDVECTLRRSLAYVLPAVPEAGTLEWELQDDLSARTLRLCAKRTFATTPGDAALVLLTVSDITEGRQLTGTLRETNRELAELLTQESVEKEAQLARLDRKLRTLSAELIMVQEAERRRIADDLHDSLGQCLSVAKLTLETAMERTAGHPGAEEVVRAFGQIRAAIAEVRSIVRNLRPSMLEEFGLDSTLELLCHEFGLSRPGLTVEHRITGEVGDLPMLVSVSVVRILQEALNNVAKHAAATHIEVTAEFSPGKVVLRVQDNGIGFDLRPLGRRRGLGLSTMRERTERTGGVCKIVSKPGSGTTVTATWSREKARAAAEITPETPPGY
jgi:signal transduction histidine kinase